MDIWSENNGAGVGKRETKEDLEEKKNMSAGISTDSAHYRKKESERVYINIKAYILRKSLIPYCCPRGCTRGSPLGRPSGKKTARSKRGERRKERGKSRTA